MHPFDRSRPHTRCWDPIRTAPAGTGPRQRRELFRQDMHVPPQAFSQQTPSTQSPPMHSLPPLQEAPIAFRHSLPVLFIHIPSVLHT